MASAGEEKVAEKKFAGGPSYREAKGGDIKPHPFWQARYYDFTLSI
jgi:hypothetical protein